MCVRVLIRGNVHKTVKSFKLKMSVPHIWDQADAQLGTISSKYFLYISLFLRKPLSLLAAPQCSVVLWTRDAVNRGSLLIVE